MDAQRSFVVSLPRGYYMSWFITTQTENKVALTLKDSVKTYYAGTRQSTKIDPPMAQGAASIEGDSLTVSITVEKSAKLKDRQNVYIIPNDKGEEVGRICNILIEDWDDDDYNDVSVSLIAWKHKG